MGDALTAALAARQPGYSYIVEPVKDGSAFACVAQRDGASVAVHATSPAAAVAAINSFLSSEARTAE